MLTTVLLGLLFSVYCPKGWLNSGWPSLLLRLDHNFGIILSSSLTFSWALVAMAATWVQSACLCRSRIWPQTIPYLSQEEKVVSTNLKISHIQKTGCYLKCNDLGNYRKDILCFLVPVTYSFKNLSFYVQDNFPLRAKGKNQLWRYAIWATWN